MIRATLVLSAAIFLTMSIAGRDSGQLRGGLATAEARSATQVYRYIPVPEAVPVVQAAVQTSAARPTAVVTAAALNLRTEPNTGSHVLDRLNHGEEVTVLDTRAGWTRIKIEGSGGEGWVSSDYLADMPVRMAGN